MITREGRCPLADVALKQHKETRKEKIIRNPADKKKKRERERKTQVIPIPPPIPSSTERLSINITALHYSGTRGNS